MDPLSALGVAANIFQLVDFSWRIVSGSIAVYKSVNGAPDGVVELEAVSLRLCSLADKVDASSLPTNTKANDKLHALTNDCRQIAQELVSLLEQLKVQGSRQKWKSLEVAFRQARKSSQVEALCKRLETLQTQLTLYLILDLRKKESDITVALFKLESQMMDFNLGRASELNQMRDDLLQALKTTLVGVPPPGMTVLDAGSSSFVPQLANVQDIKLLSEKAQAIADSISTLVSSGQAVSLETRVLKSLAFPVMRQRHEDIPEAYTKTFQWIFDETTQMSHRNIHFVDWLRHKSGVYWVSGKAGSGKSTLMKYILARRDTREMLRTWAGGQKLVTAEHFFWSPGAMLQRSQDGLLRSLLFDVLSACPRLVRDIYSVVPMAYEDLTLMSWTRSKLMEMILTVIGRSVDTKFCFFIDGLDEYGSEDSDGLICTIKHLSSHASVKLCVSSRPWNEFKEAFGTTSRFHLFMEQLTKEDIQSYITTTFEQNRNYQTARAQDQRYIQLIENMVDKANGVFLWVVLVVRSLVRGMTNADRIQDLQERLHALPPDLEKMFEQILNSIEDEYKRRAGRTLSIALRARQPIDLLVYSFLDEDINFAKSDEPRRLTTNDVRSRMDEMEKRINARSKGLLEVKISHSGLYSIRRDHRVEFIHRSARDYLLKSSVIQTLLDSADDTTMDNFLSLQYAYLAKVKYCMLSQHQKDFQEAADGVLGVAAEIEQTMPNLTLTALEMLRASYVENFKGIDGKQRLARDAARHLLTRFMTQWEQEEPGVVREYASSLMLLIICSEEWQPSRDGWDRLCTMLELLFESGADPYYASETEGLQMDCWTRVLRRLSAEIDGNASTSEWFQPVLISIVTLFVRYGARLDARMPGVHGSERISVRAWLRKTLPTTEAEKLILMGKDKQRDRTQNAFRDGTQSTCGDETEMFDATIPVAQETIPARRKSRWSVLQQLVRGRNKMPSGNENATRRRLHADDWSSAHRPVLNRPNRGS